MASDRDRGTVLVGVGVCHNIPIYTVVRGLYCCGKIVRDLEDSIPYTSNTLIIKPVATGVPVKEGSG